MRAFDGDRELIRISAAGLAERLRRREIRAADVVAAHLERIRERERTIHAWAAIDAERALEHARALDRGPVGGPLHGLPVGVKDVIDTAALPTELGSPIFRGRRPVADAACVAALERAGAIVLGKTVTTELATFRPAGTANPRNRAHSPGGSSSGSAAAVADLMVPLALGTQTFGSVIRPASYCGIVGYKPTFGVIPREGAKLLAQSLDTIGVFARSVADAALAAGAAAGRAEPSAFRPFDTAPRIGLCKTHEWREVDDAGRTAFDEASRLLSEAGAAVVDVELPAPFAGLGAACEDIYGYELSRNLAAERAEHGALLSERLRAAIDEGARVSSGRYESAQRLAQECRASLPALLRDIDVLLTPSTTGEAPAGLETTGSPIMNRAWTLLHVPAVNVPALCGPSGLPIGLQVIGRFGDDGRTLAAAAWIHERLVGARASDRSDPSDRPDRSISRPS